MSSLLALNGVENLQLIFNISRENQENSEESKYSFKFVKSFGLEISFDFYCYLVSHWDGGTGGAGDATAPPVFLEIRKKRTSLTE